jgi:hypothetical protein
LYPDTKIVGPVSLNVVDFITLGLPLLSELGDVTIESFTLENGWLYERSGRLVYFLTADELDESEYGVTQSGALKAGDHDGECGEFCVDQEGYLVSVGSASTPLSTSKTDRVTNDGDYVRYRVKFHACPNGEQDLFGGGQYKVFLSSVSDEHECVPIYLGVKSLFGYSLKDAVNL